MAIEGDRHGAGFFSPGNPLSASHLNDLSAFASRGGQTYSSGGVMAQGTFGTVDLSNGQQPMASQRSYDYPFKVNVTKDTAPGSWKVYVRAGTVNSFIPKVLGGPDNGKYLDTEPAPYLPMSSSTTGNKYVVLRATVDENKKFFPDVTDVYLVDSLESLTDSDNDGKILIASIALKKESGQIVGITKINQFIYSSQGLVRVKPGGGQACIWSWTSR